MLQDREMLTPGLIFTFPSGFVDPRFDIRLHLNYARARRRLRRAVEGRRRRAISFTTVLAEIDKHLGKHTKVVDVHGGDIAEMHRRISESVGRGGKPRKVRANRILTVCSKMFSLSLVPRAKETLPWRNAVLGNPCKGIERNPEEGRERYFSQVELAAISDALAEYPGVAADCVRLIMLTGCRPVEAMKATWSEFDSEPGYWIKPSAHVKQRKTHKLPLSSAAIELVERLRSKRRGPTWVFPGDVKGEHLAALWHVWHFVRKRTGLGEDARLYDLRHTFASVGAGGGLSLPMFQVTGAFAEFERSLIRQRIHAGLKRAVANGETLGRPLNDPEAIDRARQWLGKGVGINKVARQVGLSNSTVARLKAEMVASA
jgi:integrase